MKNHRLIIITLVFFLSITTSIYAAECINDVRYWSYTDGWDYVEFWINGIYDSRQQAYEIAYPYYIANDTDEFNTPGDLTFNDQRKYLSYYHYNDNGGINESKWQFIIVENNVDYGPLKQHKRWLYIYPADGINGCDSFDTDGDGVLDQEDLCPGTPTGTIVDDDGCPTDDTDGDGVPDIEDLCPGTPDGVTVDINGCPVIEEKICLYHVLKTIKDISTGCYYYIEVYKSDDTYSSYGDPNAEQRALNQEIDVVIDTYSMPPYDPEEQAYIFNGNNTCAELAHLIYSSFCEGEPSSEIGSGDEFQLYPDVLEPYDADNTQLPSIEVQGGESDSELYEIMIGNQNVGTKNLKEIAQLVGDIKQGQNYLIKRMDAPSPVSGELPPGTGSGGEQGKNLLSSSIDGIDSQVESEISTKTGDTLQNMIDDFDLAVETKQILDVTLQLNDPVCSVDVPVVIMGNTSSLTISLCEYQTILQWIGQILLIMFSVNAINIIFR